jgi:hypothetical protein
MMKAQEHFFLIFWVFLHSVGHQAPMSAAMITNFAARFQGGSFSAHLSLVGPARMKVSSFPLIPSLSKNPKP